MEEVQKQLFAGAKAQTYRKTPVTESYCNKVAELKPVITIGLCHRCFPFKQHFRRTPRDDCCWK